MNTTKRKTAASDSELDAELLRLAAEYTTLNNEINAGLHTVDGDVVDEAAERVSAMEAKIGLLPVPCTLSGVAALLRVKAACIGTRWPERDEDRIVLLALNALERYIADEGKEAVVRRVASIPEPDAELLRLNAEYREFLAELNAGGHRDAEGDVSDEAQERMSAFEQKIADTPSATYAGIVIKLRIAADNFAPLGPGETRTWDELNLESALADAERLAGADAELLALEAAIVNDYANWKAGKVKDDEAEEHGERVSDMDQRFAEMPAHTLSGVAAKLRHLRRLLVDDGTLRTGDIRLVETALAAVEQANRAGTA